MPRPDAARVIDAARAAGLTIATAESLTGGALCHALVAPPGASDVVYGGVIAYTPALKESLLGVDAALIDLHGTVSGEVAESMARGACAVTGAALGVATTGVAGPGELEGKPAGRVHISVAVAGTVTTERFDFEGDRPEVVARACDAAITMLARGIDAAHSGA